jgi:predicted PhzF superfamily epimerase YddE/YHI9
MPTSTRAYRPVSRTRARITSCWRWPAATCWPHGGAIDVVQGEDMGMRSLLHAEFGVETGGSVRVSGTARQLVKG